MGNWWGVLPGVHERSKKGKFLWPDVLQVIYLTNPIGHDTMIAVEGGMVVEIDGVPCDWGFHVTNEDQVLEK